MHRRSDGLLDSFVRSEKPIRPSRARHLYYVAHTSLVYSVVRDDIDGFHKFHKHLRVVNNISLWNVAIHIVEQLSIKALNGLRNSFRGLRVLVNGTPTLA